MIEFFFWLVVLCLLSFGLWCIHEARKAERRGRELAAEIEAYLLKGRKRDEE